ncbi:MAG: SDR family NAD(P)-dependent oxidoreductase [Candidatus Cloacimonetes bacterium]|nr:SDR family NAD(P)-dependent oxidoreductase [Candidatus Cloacimonadota bacterium]
MVDDFLNIEHKVLLITGASSGIGRSIARICYASGAKLILLGRDENKMAETTAGMNPEAFYPILIDLTHYKELEEAIDQAVQQMGKIDGFCHCAGFEKTLSIKAMKPDYYMDLFLVNAVAGFELARLLSKKKYCSEAGSSFVFISSITSIVGRAGLTAYSASKGAIVSATKAMAIELARQNIRVNSVSPGTVMTPLMDSFIERLGPEQKAQRLSEFPLGFGNPDDVANLVAFLFSHRSKWITGTNIIIDGGYTAK